MVRKSLWEAKAHTHPVSWLFVTGRIGEGKMPNCFQVVAMEAKVLGQIQASVRARGEGNILMKGWAGGQ